MRAATDRVLFALPEFMATNIKKSDIQRPQQPHVSNSHTRADPPVPERLTRNQRASTIHNGVIPEGAMAEATTSKQGGRKSRSPPDAFEKSSEDDDSGPADEGDSKAAEKEEELPIELASLSDRLGGPVYEMYKTNIFKFHRLPICQGASNATYRRQIIWIVSRLLRSCCNAYQHAHLYVIF